MHKVSKACEGSHNSLSLSVTENIKALFPTHKEKQTNKKKQ